ncbi:MAG TPA: methyltransferase domain-containing protein [Acidimicrobiales bacterium]|jgi:hypothetical protein|nr:methyltransferase domain-containing protein [Acidimicrobiales bacterium]
MRHLVSSAGHGLDADPRVVAELGPGDSLGTGIAAILTGAARYYALDVVSFADIDRNLAVLDGLVALFRQRARIPEGEFAAAPILASRDFPDAILTDARLARALDAERLAAVRGAVASMGTDCDGIKVAYAPAWMEAGAAPDENPDMIFSQAVLEHVDDLETTYRRTHEWLAPDGFVSHEIDLTSHGFAKTWNGHWTHSDRAWRAIRGRRRFAINREPLSTHLRLLHDTGFRVVYVHRVPAPAEIRRDQLAPRFDGLSDDDLTTCNAMVLAVKA